MEYLPALRIHRPSSAEDAVALFGSEPNPRFLAGGTDMVVNIRRGIEQPETLIDLTAIDGFSEIKKRKSGVSIGAGVTLSAIATDDIFARVLCGGG